MKNPTTPDAYRMIRRATILAVSSQARLSEAPGRGATWAGIVLRLLDRSATFASLRGLLNLALYPK